MQEVSKLWGVPRRGAFVPLGRGTTSLYEKHIYCNEILMQDNIYSGMHFAWLKYSLLLITYLLVPVLAQNLSAHFVAG
jgi:hypothetical protein